ncbi:hypothetical protein KEM55_007551, partial [Ascosphaera atra]
PYAENGIEISEVVPAPEPSNGLQTRVFRLPQWSAHKARLLEQTPKRSIVWRVKGGRLRMKQIRNNDKQIWLLQSRGKRLDGEDACQQCQKGKGPFTSCVVDISSKPLGQGRARTACLCIRPASASIVCRPKMNNQLPIQAYAKPPLEEVIRTSRKTSLPSLTDMLRSEAEDTGPVVGQDEHKQPDERKPTPASSINTIVIDDEKSVADTSSSPVRQTQNGSIYRLFASSVSKATPAPEPTNIKSQSLPDHTATASCTSSTRSTPAPAATTSVESSNNSAARFFQMPQKLSPNSLADINVALEELDGLRSTLENRKRVLECVFQNTWN